MRDLIVLLIVASGFAMTFRRPWVGVLVLAWISYMSPQVYTYGFMRGFQLYLVGFAVVATAWLFTNDKRAPPGDWRVRTFYMLWAWYAVTTSVAAVPDDAWQKFIEVSKVYLPLLFTLTLITTRERLAALLATIAASIGILAVKGGVFSIAKGFSHRVWGPDGTMYGGNNEFAIATLMIVPLLLLLRGEVQRPSLRTALSVAVVLCFASALGSWSRGALLSMIALGAALIMQSRRKWMALPLAAIGAPLALGVLPQEWFDRMDTMKTYEEDDSAMGRIDTWTLGLHYVTGRPITGGGFDCYTVLGALDWHSQYVEVLVEHGVVGALLWGALIFGSMVDLTRLARGSAKRPELEWVQRWALLLRASFIPYVVGGAFLGISYWDLSIQLVFCSVVLRRLVEHNLERSALAGRSTTPAPGTAVGSRPPGSRQATGRPVLQPRAPS